MKNIYCVGQVVIEHSLDQGRVNRVVKGIVSDSLVLLDDLTVARTEEITPLPDYMDTTSYFYHHRRFGDGLEMMNEGFSTVQFINDEKAELIAWEAENSPRPTFHSFLDARLKEAENKVEKGYSVYRTALYNLAQWDEANNRPTIDHHFPFLNPENIEY